MRNSLGSGIISGVRKPNDRASRFSHILHGRSGRLYPWLSGFTIQYRGVKCLCLNRHGLVGIAGRYFGYSRKYHVASPSIR